MIPFFGKPKNTGWYWHYDEADGTPRLFYVYELWDKKLEHRPTWSMREIADGVDSWWSGPVTAPPLSLEEARDKASILAFLRDNAALEAAWRLWELGNMAKVQDEDIVNSYMSRRRRP